MPKLPELWIECKTPCADCPRDTTRTAKVACAHPWRHIVAESIDPETGEVPFDIPERCYNEGATVANGEINGKRPSIQILIEPPVPRHGYNSAKIADN